MKTELASHLLAAGGGFSDLFNGQILKWQGVVKNGISLGSLVMIAAVYFKTKALAATLGAVLLACVVLFAINNTGWLQDKTDAEVKTPRTAVVIDITPPKALIGA